MSTNTVQSHIATIVSELTASIRAEELAEFAVPQLDPAQAQRLDDIETRLFTIANRFALECQELAPHYSNFHTWEAFRKLKTPEQVLSTASAIPSLIRPFENCFTTSSLTATALKHALLVSNKPDLIPYAARVELATNNWAQQANSARDYHCFTMLRLHSHSIFIDLNAYAGAMKIPLNTPQMTSINGFQHLYLAIGSTRLLMEYYLPEYQTSNTLQHWASKQDSIYCDPYRTIRGGATAGMLNLAIPADTHPGNGFCVNTLCLKIDFNDHSLMLKKIPLGEWLLKPENKGLYQALRGAGTYQRNGDRLTATPGAFNLDLGECEGGVFDEGVGKMGNLMDEICRRLGMPGGEVRKIAGVMLEVWGEERRGFGET